MPDQHTLFVFVTASSRCREIGELVSGSIAAGWRTYTVATPNVAKIIDPAELFTQPGAHWISDYEQPPLDTFPFGTMLVAPCTFNSFNKLALGIADTLATSMVADALGAGCPVFIAPSMNHGLWHHPQTRVSYERLVSWGCTIIDPQISERQVIMAPIPDILACMKQHFETPGD
jgi:phosphopantothenoylcysteine synthetase/decarboxylase